MKIHKRTLAGGLASTLVLSCAGLALSGPAQAAEVYLQAQQYYKNYRDGSGANGNGVARIRMWGYRECQSDWTGCGPVQSPGPEIRVPAGDTTLTIHVRNRLPATVNPNIVNSTSMYIPGLPKAMTPERWPGTHPEFANRIFSFDTVTPRTPNSQSVGSYTWTDLRPGTFLYHSGTHPQLQVQMGLYGAVVVEQAAGEAYPGVTFDQEKTLVFSEIDPAIHDAVDNNTYGTAAGPTSTQLYQPRFFLMNGVPFYAPNTPPIINAGAGDDILLRMVNAGLENHSLQILGGYFDLIAEDAHVPPVNRSEHTVALSAGKTRDVLFTPPVTDTHVLYDRALRTVNDTGHNGGIFGRIRVGVAGSGGQGANKPGPGNEPLANNDTFFINTFNGTLNTGAPGVLANDTDPNNDPLRVKPPLSAIRSTLVGAPAGAVVSVSTSTNPDFAGRVTFNPNNPSWVGIATFEYVVIEMYPGIPFADQLESAPAVVTLVRDLAITQRIFRNRPGTATDQWDLAGNSNGANSVTVTIVQNANNSNCTLVGNSYTATMGAGDSWTLTDAVPNPAGCNRMRVDAEMPAVGDIAARTASIEVNFQRAP